MKKRVASTTDVDMARFYSLQAEIQYAQTKRASRILTVSTLASIVIGLVLVWGDTHWIGWSWSWIMGCLVYYRCRSWINPEKYDNVNVDGRRIDAHRAAVELMRLKNKPRLLNVA